jgi:putative hydrolase of the HAD superfamily
VEKIMASALQTPMEPRPTPLGPKGALRRPLQALLCDIYGTLFISGSGDLAIAGKRCAPGRGMDQLLARYQLDIAPENLIQSLFDAIGTAHRQARGKGIDVPEVRIDTIWSKLLPFKSSQKVRRFAMEFEMIMNPVWPMPGLGDLIYACRNNGIRLGIISNAQFFTPYLFEWFLGKNLQALGFDPDLVFYSYLHGRAKPSPYLYQLAVEKLNHIGIPVEQTAYIGNDMRNDIAPARKIGFQTVLFAGDGRSLRLREDDPACRNIDPDMRITRLVQLIPYVTTRNK